MPFSRTHRPRLFNDVTGQSHITETLRNEISSGILGHAYLFSGPRGIGKTTTARIFAKALLNNDDVKNGEPPEDSVVSKEIDAGSCIDLIEIDAASHTGVENIREAIIEHVRFAPARWKRKVYIIDECHMLSASAWNALLKTLEEPPAYAFFILATTELHKVPDTIKSRCQRFEFRRIEAKDLADRVLSLAKLESLSIDKASVDIIVRASDGCVRDAESLLEQVSSLADGGKITQEIVSLVLPRSDIPQSASLLSDALRRDLSASLQRAKDFVEEGMPPLSLIDGMLQVVRFLICAENPNERKRLEEGDDGEKATAELIGSCSLSELGNIALMLIERRRDAKAGTDPMFCLELSLLAIAGGLLTDPPSPSKTWAMEGRGEEEKRNEPASNRPSPVPKRIIASTNTSTKASDDARNAQTSTVETEPPIEPVTDVISQTVQESDHAQCPMPNALNFDIHDVRKYWTIITKEVEKSNRALPFVLKVCKPHHMDGCTVVLRFEYAFHREKLIEDLKTKRIVEEAIRLIMKNDTLLIDGFCDKGDDGVEVPIEQISQDVVSRVLNAFGGQVVE
ncbi:MAG: DNA polymerase III subunit gamma/tau [Patescibacteria group bacterium]